MPLATWSAITERSSESATSAAISTPRFIGPGCMTMAWSAMASSRRPSSPYSRAYSRRDGKNPARCRSSWTRSIITTSCLGRTASRS